MSTIYKASLRGEIHNKRQYGIIEEDNNPSECLIKNVFEKFGVTLIVYDFHTSQSILAKAH